MKFISKALFIILLELLSVVFAGSAGIDGINNSNGSSELKVALLDFGPITDNGWTYEAHIGAFKMAKDLPYVNLSEKENASGPEAPKIMKKYADDGYKIIFCHSYNFGDDIREVAPEYLDVIFIWGSGVKKLAPNAGTYFGRLYEVQYLAGIVAGSMTKTDKIGFSAALPTSEVVRGIDAFAKGVRLSNHKAKVYVEWIGNWYDPLNETRAAYSLINRGCDVITHHSDSDATGIVAEKTGTYFISFGSDVGELNSHLILTGSIWNWEPIMTDIVESVHNGTWKSHPNQDWWYGLAEGGVKLAPLGSTVPGNVTEIVKMNQDAIAKRQLEIFPGMSDEDLRKIYYFEPNVIGDLPKQ